ncbi:MAG: radical SAM protein, partial [Rhizobiales bacterium]|nr:radical SAM protein [Hyphomicrobiales bacterium]
MEPATVGKVLDAVARHWNVAPNAEITMEANPSSVEAERFRGYRAAGVNRVSLGVQALDDRELKFLGRLHNVEEAYRAIEIARATFPRLSFDLIYARPGQTPEAWAAELRQALSRAADHLSLYQLTVEEGTPFANLYAAGKLKVPDPDAAADLYAVTQEICDAAGMPAYEVSNHARPGAECRHNLVDGRHATSTERLPEAWLARVEARGEGLIVDDILSQEEEGDEMLLMGLRLAEGIDVARYQALSGRALDPAQVADLVAHGMVERTLAGHVRATRAGFFVLDAVVADLAA